MQRPLLALVLAALASAGALAGAVAPMVDAHPTDCTEYVMGFARSCRGLPSGQRGYYVDSIGFFVFAGTGERGTEAGAGSLAGGTVLLTGGHATVVAYAHTVVAYDTVTVRVAPDASRATGDAWGVTVTAPVDHVGFWTEEHVTAVTFAGDEDADGTPDAWVRVAGREVRLLP